MTTGRPLRIRILGIVSLNGGDAAILDAQLAMLEREWPTASVTVHDRNAAVASKYLPNVDFVPFLAQQISHPRGARYYRGALKMRRAFAMLRARVAGWAPVLRFLLPPPMRGVDLWLYTGGTTLTENYKLDEKLFDLELVRRSGTPYAFFPQSAGPFRKPVTIAALRPVFRDAALVLLRDDRSYRHVVETGAAPARSKVVPDAAFALALEETVASPANPVPRVAVSVRDWEHYTTRTAEDGRANCVAAFRSLVERLVTDRGAQVTFVSTCQGRPEYAANDAAFAEEIRAGLPAEVASQVVVDGELRTTTELRDLYATFDVVVSMRLHAAILAVCSWTPTLTVAYEYKSTEVWRQLDLHDWTVDLETLSADELCSKAEALLDDRAAVSAHLRERVSRARDEAFAMTGAIRAASGRTVREG